MAQSVLPKEIGDAAQDGEMSQVCAWLDAGGSVDARDDDGFTLVNCCAYGPGPLFMVGDEQLALARHLVSRGANVNICPYDGVGWSPLHHACGNIRTDCAASSMVSLLLAAGANVNARNQDGDTPLAIGLNDFNAQRGTDHWLDVVTLLLKGGASLDECRSGRSAEDILVNGFRADRTSSAVPSEPEQENVNRLADNFLAVKALIDNVRKHGSYKRYMRAPHRDVLACRSLAMRGYLAPKGTRRTRGAQKWKAAVAFLAKQGDNGIVWTVLSYWRATE
ncbi:unnamed protein product [Pelagomonas calceolata]|uniref:Uncharacterized protein n=1 Tax=Pelagomonas calceolata TaxID=35677 RepID=A0A8J2SND6_9STRA|nr:unnamed protein product [Pelagomonas calceolata]